MTRRRQIEVNHRDEKQHLGIADAQVWNDHSVDRVPVFGVAAYAFLQKQMRPRMLS